MGNRISLRVSTGFLIEIITGLFYSVKLPKLALYQTELRPDTEDVLYTIALEKATTIWGIWLSFFARGCIMTPEITEMGDYHD